MKWFTAALCHAPATQVATCNTDIPKQRRGWRLLSRLPICNKIKYNKTLYKNCANILPLCAKRKWNKITRHPTRLAQLLQRNWRTMSNMTIVVTEVRSASFGLVLHAQHIFANSFNFLVTWWLPVSFPFHMHTLCIYTVFHKKQPLWFFYCLLLCLCQIVYNFY